MPTLTIPSKTINVEIAGFNHQVGVRVAIQLAEYTIEPDGTHTPTPIDYATQQSLIRVIDGVNYTELISANPAWAPLKPANTFREEDLWHFIT